MQLPDKIYIIGGAGSGKSTLAKKLSAITHIPFFCMDDIMWQKKYTLKRPVEERTRLLTTTILDIYDTWIVEWFAVDRADECYKQADLVIVFDVPKYIVAWRILRRTLISFFKWDFTQHGSWFFSFISWAMKYTTPWHPHSFARHIEDCKKYACNYIIIHDAKEIFI